MAEDYFVVYGGGGLMFSSKSGTQTYKGLKYVDSLKDARSFAAKNLPALIGSTADLEIPVANYVVVAYKSHYDSDGDCCGRNYHARVCSRSELEKTIESLCKDGVINSMVFGKKEELAGYTDFLKTIANG